MRFSLRAALLLFSVFSLLPSAHGEESDLKTLLAKAIADAQKGMGAADSPAIAALMKELPKDKDGSFIVEGDLALNEHELEDHLASLSPGVKASKDNPELLLNQVAGVNDFYEDKADRVLTYAIDKTSFATEQRYADMVALMDKATSDWMTICPACAIHFVHDATKDALPDTATVNFVVQLRDAGGLFVARSFFPHDTGSNRILTIDPSFYTSDHPHLGLLEHELGHILGYRHEQVRGVPGCGAVGSDFVALTDYDNQSIMHYFCGGGGNKDMVLSQRDKEGHRLVYQLASP